MMRILRYLPFLAGALSLLVALVARIRLLSIPFERDEAIFVQMAKALLRGDNLYSTAIDNKLPGLYGVYALFVGLFGDTATGVHTGVLIWQILTWGACFWLCSRVLDRGPALLATGIFALYAAAPQVMGFAGHATQLLALPALLGVGLLLRNPSSGSGRAGVGSAFRMPYSEFLAGLLFGLAILIKQQAFFYPIAGGLFLLWQSRQTANWKQGILRVLLFAAGVFLPYIICYAWYVAQGRLEDFWFWTVEMPGAMAGDTTSSKSGGLLREFGGKVLQTWGGVWLLALAGAVVAFRKTQAWILPVLLLFSLLATAVSGLFYQHYFVLALPWAALCAVLGWQFISDKIPAGGLVALLAALLWPLAQNNAYWFSAPPRSIIREVYGMNPFVEMQEVGDALKKRMRPGDVAVAFGSEPELALYTGSAAPPETWFFYPRLPEGPQQQRFREGFNKFYQQKTPRFVVIPSALLSIYMKDKQFESVFQQLRQNYQAIGVGELYPDKTEYNWNPGPAPVPKTKDWIIIVERKAIVQ